MLGASLGLVGLIPCSYRRKKLVRSTAFPYCGIPCINGETESWSAEGIDKIMIKSR